MKEQFADFVPVIIAGGSGKRLWPKSRGNFPKQFLELFGSKSMLGQTLQRVSKTVQPIRVVCNHEHRFLVAEEIKELGLSDARILLEPVGRNTAPAITLAAIDITSFDEEQVMVVLPSDHYISDDVDFLSTVLEAVDQAKKGAIVCIGAPIDRPETGYGYIKKTSNEAKSDVAAFVEKPTKELALEYMKEGSYVWNTGIFVFKCKIFLGEMKKYNPRLLGDCESAYAGKVDETDFLRIPEEKFKVCQNISIDYALMEKTRRSVVVDMRCSWSDLGSWASVWEFSEKKGGGNVANEKTFLDGCSDCLIESDNKVIVGIGLSDLVFVDTEDATLIAQKDSLWRLNMVWEQMAASHMKVVEDPLKVRRPWGSFKTITKDKKHQVKLLEVYPGHKISLQYHTKRSEHWIVVSGTARVTIGDQLSQVEENGYVFVPLGVNHRLENASSKPLQLIEVQFGDYLGEDDIVRLDDVYGRENPIVEA